MVRGIKWCVLSIAIISLFIMPSSQFPATDQIPAEDEPCKSPPTFISNGHVTISDDGWRAEYLCREDFVLIGPIEVTCIDGSWSPNPPYCLGTGCAVLPAMDHATVVYQYGGAIAEVQCEEGYTLPEGVSPLLTCHEHDWNISSALPPKCVKVGEEQIETPEIDDVTRQHNANLAKADYSCVASENGGGVPPPLVANAVAIPQWTLVEGLPRLYATYRCRWHHVLQGDISSATVYCQNGQWVGNVPQCVALEKDKVKVAAQEVDDISGLSHEEALELADYSCVDGAKMVDPPPMPNAYVTLQVFFSAGQPHLFGELSCRAGGQLVGGSSKYIYCVQGKWLLPSPAVKCSSAPAS